MGDQRKPPEVPSSGGAEEKVKDVQKFIDDILQTCQTESSGYESTVFPNRAGSSSPYRRSSVSSIAKLIPEEKLKWQPQSNDSHSLQSAAQSADRQLPVVQEEKVQNQEHDLRNVNQPQEVPSSGGTEEKVQKVEKIIDDILQTSHTESSGYGSPVFPNGPGSSSPYRCSSFSGLAKLITEEKLKWQPLYNHLYPHQSAAQSVARQLPVVQEGIVQNYVHGFHNVNQPQEAPSSGGTEEKVQKVQKIIDDILQTGHTESSRYGSPVFPNGPGSSSPYRCSSFSGLAKLITEEKLKWQPLYNHLYPHQFAAQSAALQLPGVQEGIVQNYEHGFHNVNQPQEVPSSGGAEEKVQKVQKIIDDILQTGHRESSGYESPVFPNGPGSSSPYRCSSFSGLAKLITEEKLKWQPLYNHLYPHQSAAQSAALQLPVVQEGIVQNYVHGFHNFNQVGTGAALCFGTPQATSYSSSNTSWANRDSQTNINEHLEFVPTLEPVNIWKGPIDGMNNDLPNFSTNISREISAQSNSSSSSASEPGPSHQKFFLPTDLLEDQ